jgi:hypothetical protein
MIVWLDATEVCSAKCHTVIWLDERRICLDCTDWQREPVFVQGELF